MKPSRGEKGKKKFRFLIPSFSSYSSSSISFAYSIIMPIGRQRKKEVKKKKLNCFMYKLFFFLLSRPRRITTIISFSFHHLHNHNLINWGATTISKARNKMMMMNLMIFLREDFFFILYYFIYISFE